MAPTAQCLLCPETFVVKDISDHIHEHIDYKPFHCNDCSIKTIRQCDLDQHTWEVDHTGSQHIDPYKQWLVEIIKKDIQFASKYGKDELFKSKQASPSASSTPPTPPNQPATMPTLPQQPKQRPAPIHPPVSAKVEIKEEKVDDHYSSDSPKDHSNNTIEVKKRKADSVEDSEEDSKVVVIKKQRLDFQEKDDEMVNANPRFPIELKDEPIDSLEGSPTETQKALENLLMKIQRGEYNCEQEQAANDKISDPSPSTNCLIKVEPHDDYYVDDEMFNDNPQYPMEPKDEPVDSLEGATTETQITFDTTSNGETSKENEIADNISHDSMVDGTANKEDDNMSDCSTDTPKVSTNKTIEIKKRQLRVNKTELECPNCEFRTRSVRSWIDHLRNKHSTTPFLAGLALLCECGHESFTDNHFRKCNNANVTVIPKRTETPKTPKCIICEAYPKTASGYVYHIGRHKSTLKENNIYLNCSCGVDVHSRTGAIKHGKDCVSNLFTLHKLEEE